MPLINMDLLALEVRIGRLAQRVSDLELELLGARNRARDAAQHPFNAHQIAPGHVLSARDLEVLLVFTAEKAAEVELRVMSGELRSQPLALLENMTRTR